MKKRLSRSIAIFCNNEYKFQLLSHFSELLVRITPIRWNGTVKRRHFALVEVMFGIVIAGIGVLALIPIMYVIVAPGQNAMVETRISLMATKFNDYIRQEIKNNWDTYANAIDGTTEVSTSDGITDDSSDPDDTLIDNLPIELPIVDDILNFSANDNDSPVSENEDNQDSDNDNNSSTFNELSAQYFGMKIYPDNKNFGSYVGVEESFEVGIRIKPEPLQVTMLNNEGEKIIVAVDTQSAMIVKMEMSWPTLASDSNPRRWNYHYVVLNSND